MRSSVTRLIATCALLLFACTGDKATGPEVVGSVAITSSITSLQYGQSVQLAATVVGASGKALTGRAVTWTSSNDNIATVSSSGLVTAGAVRGGTAETMTITATSEGKSASVPISIAPIPAATIAPLLAQVSIYVGQTVQLGVTLKDVTGASLTGRVVTWTSNTPSVATLTAQGLMTAIAPGSATITAAAEGMIATVNASVTLIPVSTVSVTVPTSERLYPGQKLQLAAVPKDSLGRALSNRKIEWSSANTAIATVSAQGLVTALSAGSVDIIAIAEGIAGRAGLIVQAFTAPTLLSLNELEQGEYPETSVAINPTNENNIVVSAPTRRYSTLDGGKSWTRLSAPTWNDRGPWHDPNVVFDRKGNLFHQGMGIPGGANPRVLYVGRSLDGGGTMSSSGIAAVYQTARAEDGSPDQGWLAIDTVSSSPFVDNLYAIFSDYPNYSTTTGVPNPPCIGFCLRVATSRDGGRTWGSPVDISSAPGYSTSGTGPQEHSASIAVGPTGEVYAVWWRVTTTTSDNLIFSSSSNGGLTWAPEKVILESSLHNHSDTWPNDVVRHNPTITIDNTSGPYRGTIYIATGEVIGGKTGTADSWIIRSSDNGKSWSGKVRITDGELAPYRYSFQPRISIAPNGRIDAAWYDTRNWTGTNTNELSYDIYYSSSVDGGRTFSPSIRVTPRTMTLITTCPSPPGGCGDRRLNEYMGVASTRTKVAISFNSVWWIPGSPPPKDPYDRRPLVPPTIAVLMVPQ